MTVAVFVAVAALCAVLAVFVAAVFVAFSVVVTALVVAPSVAVAALWAVVFTFADVVALVFPLVVAVGLLSCAATATVNATASSNARKFLNVLTFPLCKVVILILLARILDRGGPLGKPNLPSAHCPAASDGNRPVRDDLRIRCGTKRIVLTDWSVWLDDRSPVFPDLKDEHQCRTQQRDG